VEATRGSYFLFLLGTEINRELFVPDYCRPLIIPRGCWMIREVGKD